MKKSFIFASVFVGILMVSLVSAGWWSDLFNSPPSVTGNVINTRGIDLDLNKLSEGVQLSKGWNYWFIWKDSEMPVAQIVSNLDASSYRYVYEYNPQTRKTAYWYGDSNSKNQFDKFVNGNNYAIYMLSSAEWKYSGDTPGSGDGNNNFEEIFVNKINPLSNNYISFNTDALVQYSANGQNKNTYGFDTNGGRITANGDLTLEPSRYIVTKSKALVHYSSDGNIKHTVELQSDGTRFTTPFDLIFDPSRYVVAKTDAIVQYSRDGQNKNTYGFDTNGGRITANGDLTLEPSKNVVIKSLVLVSPNGNQWKLKVSDSGQLSTERVY